MKSEKFLLAPCGLCPETEIFAQAERPPFISWNDAADHDSVFLIKGNAVALEKRVEHSDQVEAADAIRRLPTVLPPRE